MTRFILILYIWRFQDFETFPTRNFDPAAQILNKVLCHNILCHRVQIFCWNCIKILGSLIYTKLYILKLMGAYLHTTNHTFACQRGGVSMQKRCTFAQQWQPPCGKQVAHGGTDGWIISRCGGLTDRHTKSNSGEPCYLSILSNPCTLYEKNEKY